MSTCPEAAADKQDSDEQKREAALLLMMLPTDEERIQARKEQANQWRTACRKCESYVRPLVLDWTPPGLRAQ